MSKDEVLGYECRHATYVVSNDIDSEDDLLVIKEVAHLRDGTTKPRLRFWKNYKRDFYITKEGFRNHKDKKLFEEKRKLFRVECTQRKLGQAIAQALRIGYNPKLRTMARSQYLYGADVPSTVLVKHAYRQRWPDLQTFNTVAVCDLETDVIWGTDEILSGTLSFKDRIVLVVNKKFVQSIPQVEKQIQEKFEFYLGKYKKERNIKLQVVIAQTPAEVVIKLLRYAHEWMPDFMAFWNIDFDIPRMEAALIKEGYDPAYYFSDPAVPEQYKYFNYNQGPSSLTTASGKLKPYEPQERWHTVETPASFYCIDAMCVYYKIRVAKGKDPSYRLDAILDKELGIRKLNFEEAEGLNKLAWHIFMQKNYQLEYLIYNVFDCISVELLDEKTKDLASTISVLNGISDYKTFSSQPRRTCDDLHFVALEQDHVIAATSDQMEDDLDPLITDVAGWVITLPAHQIIQHGVRCIVEFPELDTNIFMHVADRNLHLLTRLRRCSDTGPFQE